MHGVVVQSLHFGLMAEKWARTAMDLSVCSYKLVRPWQTKVRDGAARALMARSFGPYQGKRVSHTLVRCSCGDAGLFSGKLSVRRWFMIRMGPPAPRKLEMVCRIRVGPAISEMAGSKLKTETLVFPSTQNVACARMCAPVCARDSPSLPFCGAYRTPSCLHVS